MFSRSIPSRILAAALAAMALAGLALEAVVLWRRGADPAFVFLRSAGSAEWIRHGRPMEMALLPLGTDTTGFRTQVRVPAASQNSLLRFRALGGARVLIDDRILLDDGPGAPGSWKQWREIDLGPALRHAATATLTVVVSRENGPPLLQASCEALALATDSTWEASRDGNSWSPAATANRIAPVPGSRAFPRSDLALWNLAPWLLPIFLFASIFRWRVSRGRNAAPPTWAVHASLAAALTVLGVNAVLRVPVWFGFDVVGHMEYIQFIIDHRRLPLATDGWKMNEAPLFYLVASIPYRWFYDSLNLDQNIVAMRWIPLLCGLAQAEIALRTARLILPGRPVAQFAGAAVAAFLPMNFYLSFYPSNQPFAGVWSALAVYLTLRRLVLSRDSERWALSVLIGICLGASVLSKITGLLTVPGALAGMAIAGARRPGSKWPVLAEPALALAAMSAICGWYFARNQMALGTPFSVGFSESLDTVWRQDPGFRAPGQLLRFGEALWYPISAGFVSYWDSLYSTFWSDGLISAGQVPPAYEYGAMAASPVTSVPPWNFEFLCAGALLSLVPMSLLGLGVLGAIARPADAVERGTLLCLFWIGTHLAGMLYLYLTLPTISAGKAAYLLNVLPCFAVLAGEGTAMLARRPLLEATLIGGMAAWAAAIYAGFFVT